MARGGGVVDTAFGAFSPRLAEIFRACLDRGHVDVPPRAGKVGGAYCTAVSTHILPYVLMNFTERLRDVTTLAHEFGHATHNVLSLEQQVWRSHRTGIPMAEVPSTFAQSLADDYLLEAETDAQTLAALASDRLENGFGAIFRQTVLARFEQRAYALRAEGAALTAERLSEVWQEEQLRYYGDSLDAPGRLPARLVVHPALHPRSLLHVCVRIRAARRAVAVRPLPRGSRGVRAALSGVPRRGRLGVAGRAARAVRPRPPLDRHLARGVCPAGRLAPDSGVSRGGCEGLKVYDCDQVATTSRPGRCRCIGVATLPRASPR